MGIVRQRVGEIVGLSLQMSDGNEILYPQAQVRDAGGSVIATLDLAHVGEGLYTNRSLFMPDNAVVTAAYRVYSDAGHTTQDNTYEETLDVFVRDTDSSVSSVSLTDATILGTVENIPLTDTTLVGIIENETIFGKAD